jgi:hypothetical protein
LQVPIEPVTLHASHAPEHAVLQQTPSAHDPLAHSAATPHVAPLAFGTMQTPPTQWSPVAHAASELQVDGQLVEKPSHKNGAQLGEAVVPLARVVHVPTVPGSVHD